MAEPLPSASGGAVDAGADNDDSPASRLPKNAEDRKAAAALDSLNTNEITQDEAGSGAAAQPSQADQEALGKAMSRLEMASGPAATASKEGGKKVAERTEDVEVKKKIKISAEDVSFLVEELDLSKIKATELLKANDGNVIQAAHAFVTPQIKT